MNSLLALVVAISLVMLYNGSVRAQIGEATETEVNEENSTVGFNEGDVKYTDKQQQYMIMLERAAGIPFGIQMAVLDVDYFAPWPNAVVPYELSSDLNQAANTAILNAMAMYETETCVRFVTRSNELDYVTFFPGNGCFSYIGRIGGPQEISIGRGCEFTGIVIHEIFHAIGRFHEQSRPDRDVYVGVNVGNVRPGFENNFEKRTESFVTVQGIEYDFSSVMHYRANAFAVDRNEATVFPLPEFDLSPSDLGQRDGFSEADIAHVLQLYCPDQVNTIGDWTSWGAWSGCSRSCNSGIRSRRRTCSELVCPNGVYAQEEDCNTESCDQVTATWGTWTTWSMCSEECGGGIRNRIRTCLNGDSCVGVSTDYSDCNTQECPPEQVTEWGAWGAWSECSKTCDDHGTQNRERHCMNGNTCGGINIETRNCNENIPCAPDPSSGEWSQWTTCSKTCGGGVRSRTRNCSLIDASLCNMDRQQETCNPDACPEIEPTLRGIRNIGCYLVPRFASPLRLLEGTTPDLSDNPQGRLDPIRKCGVGALLQDSQYFSLSVGYCISGSNNINDYQTFEVDEDFCYDGIGGYIDGYFIMDVYELFDVPSFSESVEPSPSPTPDTGINDGAVSLFVSSTILFSLTILLSLYYMLLN